MARRHLGRVHDSELLDAGTVQYLDKLSAGFRTHAPSFFVEQNKSAADTLGGARLWRGGRVGGGLHGGNQRGSAAEVPLVCVDRAAHRRGDVIASPASGDVHRTTHGGGRVEAVRGEDARVTTHGSGDIGVLAL